MSSETNVYQMKGNNMSNIHKKLYNACNHSRGVKKASKVKGSNILFSSQYFESLPYCFNLSFTHALNVSSGTQSPICRCMHELLQFRVG